MVVSTPGVGPYPWCIDPNALGGGSSGTSWYVVKPLALTR
jgi:hypothetical protein